MAFTVRIHDGRCSYQLGPFRAKARAIGRMWEIAHYARTHRHAMSVTVFELAPGTASLRGILTGLNLGRHESSLQLVDELRVEGLEEVRRGRRGVTSGGGLAWVIIKHNEIVDHTTAPTGQLRKAATT